MDDVSFFLWRWRSSGFCFVFNVVLLWFVVYWWVVFFIVLDGFVVWLVLVWVGIVYWFSGLCCFSYFNW